MNDRHAARCGPAILLLSLASATAASAQVEVAEGFHVEVFADGPELSYLTGLAFDSGGVLHVTEADVITNSGRVLRVEDSDGDGVADRIEEHATGLGLATGLTFRGKGLPRRAPEREHGGRRLTDLERIRRGLFRGQALDLFVSHFTPGLGGTGTLSRLADRDRDGVAEEREDIVTGLPSDGLNGNQQPAVGPDGWLYFGMGARTNAGIPSGGPADANENAAILRVRPDGSELQVHATGLRNAFDLAFTPEGELLATENGPDDSGPGALAGAPDELNAIVAGGDYGWPDHFGSPPIDTGTIGPLVTFGAGTSTDGLAVVPPDTFCGLEGDLLVAQFGSFVDPGVGRRLVLIRRDGLHAMRIETFATGFGRPLDLAFGPDGALYVADFSNVFLAPRTATIYRIAADDADADGTPDACEP